MKTKEILRKKKNQEIHFKESLDSYPIHLPAETKTIVILKFKTYEYF